MHKIKSFLRNTLATLLLYSGVLHLCLHLMLRKKVVVLTYHRVLPPERMRHSFSSRAIIVSPEVFAMHLECVRKWLRPLMQTEFLACTEGSAAPPRSCLVTFDDGWYDNYEYALPILRRYQVPMTLFVATDYIDSDRCFWQESLAALLYQTRRLPASRPLLAELDAAELATASDENARRLCLELVARIKADRRDPAKLLARLRDLSANTEAESEDRFMSLEQLRDLERSGLVSVGSHAMSHSRLDQLSDAGIMKELAGSRDVIARWVSAAPLMLAYPNGDYDERTTHASRSAGYRAAFTTRRGYFTPGQDAHAIRRINMHAAVAPTKALFLCRVLGLI